MVVLDGKLQNITGGKYIAALHKEADGYGDCCVMSVLIEDHLQFTGDFFVSPYLLPNNDVFMTVPSDEDVHHLCWFTCFQV